MEAVSSLSLKRRFEEVDSGSPYSTPKNSDDDISSSDSADSCDSLNPPSSTALIPTSILRRHKPSPGRKRVRFDVVTVYYFPRQQGFTSVPSQGGSSLGMARHHCSIRSYTLGEFACEQETSHRHALRQHLRQEKLNARKMKLTRNGTVECAQADLLTLDNVSDDDLDVEGVEVDDCFFLQPLPTKRRRALLRASGNARIDAREKAELRTIRLSREECGCDCRFYCDPRHCGCSQAGIKCQVDRMSFPCGCSRDGCRNSVGRIEFNPLRVRTHYLHTIMKLDLEKRRLLGQRSGVGEQYEESDLLSSPSSTRPPSPDPDLSTGAHGLDSELETEEREVQMVLEAQDLLTEQACLERENEIAVLHLQSAEEQERMREEEEEEEAQRGRGGAGSLGEQALCLLPGALQGELSGEPGVGVGVEGVPISLLQGPFPTGATLLCITENQEGNWEGEGDNPRGGLKDPASSLLYYQLGPMENEPFEESQPVEEEECVDKEPGGGEEQERVEHRGITCGQDEGEFSPPVALCTENGVGAEGAKEVPFSPQQSSSEGQCQEVACLATGDMYPPLPPEV
nr:cysteine/serine-rich nuclear protein 2-like [Oncorhynchus nerka]